MLLEVMQLWLCSLSGGPVQADALLNREDCQPDRVLLLSAPQAVLLDRAKWRRLDPQTRAVYHAAPATGGIPALSAHTHAYQTCWSACSIALCLRELQPLPSLYICLYVSGPTIGQLKTPGVPVHVVAATAY